MRRRDLLAGAASLTVGATASFPTPAIAQGLRELKMVTDWPETMPGLQASARRFAQTVDEATDGRIKVEVFPANALVRAFETFDAVGAGVADMYHSFEGYFSAKSPLFHFYSAMPFGFTANELFAWVHHGGGQELWDALSGPFNVKPLVHAGDHLAQGVPGIAVPDGRSRRRGASAIGRHRGDLAWRRDHVGAEVWGDRRQRMDRPWLDMAIGLHKAVGYYYYPAFHEPGSGFSLGINRGVWDSLNAGDRRLIAAVAAAEYVQSLAEFNTNNALALGKLRDEGGVKLLKFDDVTLKALREVSKDVIAEIGSGALAHRKPARDRILERHDVGCQCQHQRLNLEQGMNLGPIRLQITQRIIQASDFCC